MKLCYELTRLEDFEAWSGGRDTKEEILNADLGDEFIALCEEMFPDGMLDGQLNDFLWFDRDDIMRYLGLGGLVDDEDDGDDEEDSEDDEDDDEVINRIVKYHISMFLKTNPEAMLTVSGTKTWISTPADYIQVMFGGLHTKENEDEADKMSSKLLLIDIEDLEIDEDTYINIKESDELYNNILNDLCDHDIYIDTFRIL